MLYIIHRVEDVTDFVRLKHADHERAEQMQAEIYSRSLQVAEANRQFKTANAVLGRLYHQISLLMSDAGEINLRPEREDDWDLLRHPLNPDEMLARVSQMISDHQRMEEQLRQSQKMEAVGRLAGGVAHDFNNLLTVIAGYCRSAVKERTRPAASSRELDEIQAAVNARRPLTRQLLAFSRKQVWQPRVLDVNAVVAEHGKMLRRLIGENILFVTALAGDLGRVKADPGQMEQVIMNLVVNARDAMPRGGKLVIETKSARLDEGQIAALAGGRYIVLSVTDTGHGISPETVSRIFEPFFTTKEVGRGTGLGLLHGAGHRAAKRRHADRGKHAGRRLHFPRLPAVDHRPAGRRKERAHRRVGSHSKGNCAPGRG